MKPFDIVAHRGAPGPAPENTVAAFQRAVDLGADAVELDVRLTADHVPVVYHYYLLGHHTSARGAVFEFTWEQLRQIDLRSEGNPDASPEKISSLAEVLAIFSGKIGLEIEVKGPEPEAIGIIGDGLHPWRSTWDSMEITSYEPALLLGIQSRCPGLATDLLYPRSPDWMTPNVMLHDALHRSRLGGARAVHLHPTQLSEVVVSTLEEHGIQVHAWDVNTDADLQLTSELGIRRLCTDRLLRALSFRQRFRSPLSK